jgi:hypothetical protein
MVLKWIGMGKVDHPMGDAAEARQIAGALSAENPAKALEEATYWLESLNRTEGFKLGQRFDNVDLLDGAVKNHLRKLSQDYLSMPRQQKFQENMLWKGIHGFWKELGDAYIQCVDQYEGGASGATAIKKNLAVIVARAMRALTLQLKWNLLRYGPIEPRIWADLARLYRIAGTKGFAEGAIVIYPGPHGDGSVKGEFLKAMMLSASCADGLPPVRQEIAERLVAQFVDTFRLSDKPEGCTHCFDLAAPKAPARLYKGAAPTGSMRFFGATGGVAALESLIGQIRDTGGVPADVNLGGTHDNEVVVGVVRHLIQYWSDTPPARGSERRQTAGRITVVPGLNQLLEALEPTQDDELDFSREQPAESWIVENVSDGGYGAIIPTVKSDWIKVGTLVGVQSETSKYWGIGLIRRIAHDEQQQRRVGIQVLSRTAIPVKVARAVPTTIAFDASRDAQPAVLLSTAPDAQGEVAVVMRVGLFSRKDSLDMKVRDKTYLLMPSRFVEGGDDFDWAKFKVMQRGA